MKFFLLIISIPIFATASIDQSEERCAFCQKEVLESQVFYRRNGAIGLLTHKPAVPGHVLIIPERHVAIFSELTSDEIASMGEAIQKIDAAIQKLYHTTDSVLIEKNGPGAGQSVPHVHFHYIPRSKEMGTVSFLIHFLLAPWLRPLTQEEMKNRASELHELLDAPALE